jgi:L,D-peptidoglycan transpeptidase YkuD (ErfK/YbiS/YcfS/YnhG family)
MNPKFHDLVVTHWGARFMGYTLPVAIGRSGIAEKVGEGDGITPIGNFSIKTIGFRNDRISFNASNIVKKHTRLNDLWSDDPRDKNYNHKVYSDNYSFSYEKLRRSDNLYDAYGVLDYNWPNAEPGKGSAIFIHAWRRPRYPTEGCIAFDTPDLIWILENWKIYSRVIIK